LLLSQPSAACGANPSLSPIRESALAGSHMKSASQFVVIDQSEPAFTVFMGIPKHLDRQKLEQIKRTVSDNKQITLLT
jgi:hypothetical protein